MSYENVLVPDNGAKVSIENGNLNVPFWPVSQSHLRDTLL